MHWPFKNFKKTYVVKKPVRQIEEKLVGIAKNPSATFKEIYCKIEDVQKKEYSFYIVISGASINRFLFFRTRLYATLTESYDKTKIETIVKTNPIYPTMLLLYFSIVITGFIMDWQNSKQGFINLGIVFFLCWGLDVISKKILAVTFERFI